MEHDMSWKQFVLTLLGGFGIFAGAVFLGVWSGCHEKGSTFAESATHPEGRQILVCADSAIQDADPTVTFHVWTMGGHGRQIRYLRPLGPRYCAWLDVVYTRQITQLELLHGIEQVHLFYFTPGQVAPQEHVLRRGEILFLQGYEPTTNVLQIREAQPDDPPIAPWLAAEQNNPDAGVVSQD